MQQFVVFDKERLIATLGAEVEAGDEAGVNEYTFESNDGYRIQLTTDELRWSIFLRIGRNRKTRFSVVREGAETMRLMPHEAGVIITFRTEDTRGELILRLDPELEVRETVLRG